MSSMGTNVKINIFRTYPVKSANDKRKNYSQKLFKHDENRVLPEFRLHFPSGNFQEFLSTSILEKIPKDPEVRSVLRNPENFRNAFHKLENKCIKLI